MASLTILQRRLRLPWILFLWVLLAIACVAEDESKEEPMESKELGSVDPAVFEPTPEVTPSRVPDEPESPQPQIPLGVEVVSVDETSVLWRAGLRAGDIVVEWTQGSTDEVGKGRIDHPFDWHWIRLERAPRGPLTLHGFRDDQPREWVVPMGAWRIEIKPPAAADNAQSRPIRAWTVFADGLRFLSGRKWDESLNTYGAALELLEPESIPARLTELAAARVEIEAGRHELASERLTDLISRLEQEEPCLLMARAYFQLGKNRRRLEDFKGASRAWREALELHSRMAPGSLAQAEIYTSIADIPALPGDVPFREEGLKALEIRRALDPLGPGLGETLGVLGNIEIRVEENEKAAVYFGQAVDQALKRNDQHSLAIAHFRLSRAVSQLGDSRRAQDYLERSISWFEENKPDHPNLGKLLNNLGGILSLRGAHMEAARVLERALEIKKRAFPGRSTVANTYTHLGWAAYRLGDFERAEMHFQSALEIHERQMPGSLEVFDTRISLAMVYIALGSFEQARRALESARPKQEKTQADRYRYGRVEFFLGEIEEKRGKGDLAEEHYLGALQILRELKIEGLVRSFIFQRLASLVLDQEDRRGQARSWLLSAEAIQRQQAPDSSFLAETLHGLGRIERLDGNTDSALKHFFQAIEILERQIDRLEPSLDQRGAFRSRFLKLYRDPILLLTESGDLQEAIQVLERFRASSFLARLAERDIDFSADVPESLRKDKRNVEKKIERRLRQLLDARQDRESDAELLKLKQEQRRIEIDILSSATRRYTDLKYPKPLDGEQIRQGLDSGTVAVAYLLGETSSNLFIIEQNGIRLESIAWGQDEIERRVDRLSHAVDQHRNPRHKDFEPEVIEPARELFEMLLGPVRPSLARAERLVIFPDGPLHELPFSMLVMGEEEPPTHPLGSPAQSVPTRPRYLAEHLPVHVALSATVYGQLRALSRESDSKPPSWVAFGDPQYPEMEQQAPGANPQLSNAVRDFELVPLPASRREVETIAALLDGDTAVFLGADAQEEHVGRIAPGAQIVHFATHARWDQRFPMDSALILTIPEPYDEDREDGLLHAWEIFESLRLHADLVVLSACSTARGRLAGGEGPISLARAFQYAGSRSVLSTLWNISDDSTAEWMRVFYTALLDGVPKDEAVRRAQVSLLESERWAAPFYWAAFQLDGDWK